MMPMAKHALPRFWLPVAAALAVHAALAISAAGRLTPTHDEYWHLPVGLLNLKQGRFDFDNLNPPLCRMAAALPLACMSAQTGPTDVNRDAMGWGDNFLDANRGRYRTWFLIGRSVIVLISVLGGLATAVWARALFGDGAGCLAAVLWAFEPNLLAHGSLVTTDMGAAAFFVFTLFALWKFANCPGLKTALLFGAVLGLAQLTKFTALLLYPLSLIEFAVILIARRTQRPGGKPDDSSWRAPPPTTPKSIAGLCGLWSVALAASLLVVNAGYVFRGSCSTLQSYRPQSTATSVEARRLAVLGWLPIPLPRDYVEGLDHQRHMMELKYPVYLDGQWSTTGFDHYYLWGLAYKLPHPLQLLLLATLLWLAMPGKVDRRLDLQLVILLPAVLMIGAAEASSMQLGIRYVLPAMPFLILFACQSARWFDLRTFPFRTVTTGVLAIWMLCSVRHHPQHLAYFNELAGGSSGGRRHLLDSNLDWGQDLGSLADFLREHRPAFSREQRLDEIGLAYFGTVPPAALGIAYQIPPSRVPKAGRFAVSVNFEQGMPHWVRTPRNEIRPVDINEFSYFGFFQPIARVGESIDIFDLSPDDIARWRAAAPHTR
jgi:Dolichyl-phosphate-mannose-protein mannosyltransferase